MPKPELSEDRVAGLRAALLARRDELRASIEHGKSDTRPVELDQQAVGRVSRIDAIQQQQMALAGRDQAAQTLQRVELALERIDAGDYGYCRQCGEEIGYARLEAQPFALLCIDCQAANENA